MSRENYRRLLLQWCIVAVTLGFRVKVVLGFTDDTRLVQGSNVNLDEALQFLREYDLEAADICFKVSSAQWKYSTNITDFNKRKMIEEQMLKAKFDKITWKKAMVFDWTRLEDPMVRRQLKILTANTRASLEDEKYNEIYHLISEMKDLYAHVRICPYVLDPYEKENIFCDLELDDVQNIMATSRNPQELLYIWTEWHDKIGPQLKNRFMRFVELGNQASRINGFLDAGEEMRYVYEDKDFENELAETFQKVQPLYKQLLTYVRRKLLHKYGPTVIRPDGPLPAHILGNLWAQDWSNIADIVMPYPKYSNFDVTEEMLRQGFTSLRMFQMAEEFYTSIGLKPMPPEFWRFSMIERPSGRRVQCTASAWDFCNKVDFRIKQCTEVDMKNLMTVHHEMAHIEYYLYYSDLPHLYKDGANPGFHEGIANAILLSVFSPVHLRRVGLYNNNTDSVESNINFLLLMALRKIAYAPFAYLVEQWRYEIFESGVRKMNTNWWDLRLRYQGIIPPVLRTEAHFDAAAKRHIPADIPYIRYYVALLLEFQIHESMCDAAGHSGPIHMCDIYRSREAGKILSEVLRSGKARHWKDIVRSLTQGRTDTLSINSMLDYFKPLQKWLEEQNRGEKVIGWTTHKEDTSLFQPLVFGRSASQGNALQYSFIFIVINLGFVI